MRAVVYARYSTENQDAASLEGQERVCRAHAERLGHQVVEVYTDAGISGTTLARPGLQRLLADAKARRFKVLVVSDLYNPGGKTYGFSSVEEPNPADPTKPRHRLVIDEGQAAIVRRVFEVFAAGNSPRAIAQQLNGEKVPAAHDGGKGHKGTAGWAHTSIRSMLRNRRYIGEVVWNAFKWKKTAKGTRRRVPRPVSEHVLQNRPELVIIAPNLWDRVQQRLGARRKSSGPVRPRVGSTFALSGLLRCGACGGNFTVVSQAKKAGATYRNLGCVAHKDHRCDNAKTVSERKVLAAVVTTLRERLSRPDRVQVFVETFRKRWAELEAEGSPTRELEGKIERARAAVANVTTALLTVPGSKALGDKLAAEEVALADLEAQLGAARAARPSILPHPAAIAAYVRNLAELMEGGDVAKAGSALRAAFQPFRMVPDVGGYRLIGAIDVGVCDEKSSGGVIFPYSVTPYLAPFGTILTPQKRAG